jgi:hypothetical protein
MMGGQSYSSFLYSYAYIPDSFGFFMEFFGLYDSQSEVIACNGR